MLVTLKLCWETVFCTALGVLSLQLIPGTFKLQSKLLQMPMREAEVPNYFCAVCGGVCCPGAQACVCRVRLIFPLGRQTRYWALAVCGSLWPDPRRTPGFELYDLGYRRP